MAGLFRRSASGRKAASSAASFQDGKNLASAGRLAATPEEARRDYAAALHAFQRVIDIGHPDYKVGAMMQSAFCCQDLGDDNRAEDFFRRVIEHRYPNLTPHAEIMLARLLERRDDVAGAVEHYQRAIDFRSPPDNMDDVWHGQATAALEILYARIGDSAGVARVREGAGDLGRLAMNRGHALESRGDLQGAIAAFREAAGDKENAKRAVAAYKLGGLLRDQGDLPGAREAFQLAADCGHETLAQQAVWERDRCL